MISEATARMRTLIAIVACVAVAAIVANVWVNWIFPSCFTGTSDSDFTEGLFLPATLVAFVFGGSDPVYRQLLFVEAFLICFPVFLLAYLPIAYVFRRHNA